MPTAYNPTVAQFRLEGSYLQQNYNNVLYCDSPAEWTAERLTSVAAVIGSWLSVDLLPNLASDLYLTGITATSMAGLNAPQVYNPFVGEVNGGRNEAAMPGSVAVVATKKSSFRGRSGRGRMYLAGLTDPIVDGNVILAGWITTVNAELAELEPALLAVNARHVIYSQYSAGALRPVGVAFPVTSFVIQDPFIDSQRGRLPGRGN